MNKTGRRPRWPWYWAAAAWAPLLLAAAGVGALVFEGLWTAAQPADALGPNQAVSLCVSVRLTAGWRLAAWWEPTVSARTGRLRPPFIQPRLACGLIPWQPWLPSNGTIQTSD